MPDRRLPPLGPGNVAEEERSYALVDNPQGR